MEMNAREKPCDGDPWDELHIYHDRPHTLLTAAGRAADDRDERGTTVKVEMWRLTSKVIGGLDSDTQPACRYKRALSMSDLAIYQWPGRVDPMPTSSLSSFERCG